MKCKSYLTAGITLIVALIGCSVAQNLPTRNWDEAKARDIALTISKTWKLSPDQFQTGQATNLEHRVYAVLPFDIPGTPRQLVLIATAPPNETCHACAPVTGAVMFELKDGPWRVEYARADIGNRGTFGQPPNAHLRRLGPTKPAVEFELDSMAQGYAGSTVIFVAEVNHDLREVLSVATGESNEAAGMAPEQTFKWQATIEVSATIHQDFADLVVKSTGTKAAEDGNNISPYSATDTYRFNGEAYVKVD
jgi:hypothetical protein